MVKKLFIEKVIWSSILSCAILVLAIFALAGRNLNWTNGSLILILASIDFYFIFSSIKFGKYIKYEKIALIEDKKTNATFIAKKTSYVLGEFKTSLVKEIYKIQFSFVDELGVMVIDETLPIFSKEQVENLETRGMFNVYIAGEKKAVLLYDKI